MLEEIARELSDDIWIVAPETDQSGVAHSLSLNDPLRLREVGERHYAVKGTPTDCVIMGVRHLMLDTPPDMILSGVNRGRNCAEDVTYSGTVAGAMEGTVLGIPSFALSQSHNADQPQPAALGNRATLCAGPDPPRARGRHAPRRADQHQLPRLSAGGCQRRRRHHVQGKRDQELLRIEARDDGRGNPYYWIGFSRKAGTGMRPGTDLLALTENRVSVTPLRLDLTDEPFMTRLAELLG